MRKLFLGFVGLLTAINILAVGNFRTVNTISELVSTNNNPRSVLTNFMVINEGKAFSWISDSATATNTYGVFESLFIRDVIGTNIGRFHLIGDFTLWTNRLTTTDLRAFNDIFRVQLTGGVLIGNTNSVESWYFPSSANSFVSVHDTSVGDNYENYFHLAATDWPDVNASTNFGSIQMNVGTLPNPVYARLNLTTWGSYTNNSYLDIYIKPETDESYLRLVSKGQTNFVVIPPTGFTGTGTNWFGDDGKFHSFLSNTNTIFSSCDARRWGVIGDGVTDDTAAVRDALNSGELEICFPVGTFYITDTIEVTNSLQTIRGIGPRASYFLFNPASSKTLFKFTKGASSLEQISFSGFGIQCISNSYEKVAMEINDTRISAFSDIEIYPWTGVSTNNIGILFKGRDNNRLQNLYINADRPLVIDTNNNSVFSLDQTHFFDTTFVASKTNSACIEVKPSVYLTQFTMDGYQSWNKGAYGFYWYDTNAYYQSEGVTFGQIRREQNTDGNGYSFFINLGDKLKTPGSGNTLQGLKIKDSFLDLAQNGVWLRGVYQATFDTVQFAPWAGQYQIRADDSCEQLLFLNCFSQQTGLADFTGLTNILAFPTILSAAMPETALWVRGTNTPNLPFRVSAEAIAGGLIIGETNNPPSYGMTIQHPDASTNDTTQIKLRRINTNLTEAAHQYQNIVFAHSFGGADVYTGDISAGPNSPGGNNYTDMKLKVNVTNLVQTAESNLVTVVELNGQRASALVHGYPQTNEASYPLIFTRNQGAEIYGKYRGVGAGFREIGSLGDALVANITGWKDADHGWYGVLTLGVNDANSPASGYEGMGQYIWVNGYKNAIDFGTNRLVQIDNTGRLYIKGVNDDGGNGARLLIQHTGPSGDIIFDSQAAGTSAPAKNFLFRSNDIPVVDIIITGPALNLHRGAQGFGLSMIGGLNQLSGTDPLLLGAGSESLILESIGFYPSNSMLPLGKAANPWGPLRIGGFTDGTGVNFAEFIFSHDGTNGNAIIHSYSVGTAGNPRPINFRFNSTNRVIIQPTGDIVVGDGDVSAAPTTTVPGLSWMNDDGTVSTSGIVRDGTGSFGVVEGSKQVLRSTMGALDISTNAWFGWSREPGFYTATTTIAVTNLSANVGDVVFRANGVDTLTVNKTGLLIPTSYHIDGTLATSDQTTNRIVANFSGAVNCTGSDYSLTTTLTNVVFGTISPSVNLPSAGTYMLNADLSIGGSASVADTFVVGMYDTSNSAQIGNWSHSEQHAASDHNSMSMTRIYTAPNACTIKLQAFNTAGARGSVVSTNTSIRFIRLN